MPNKTIYISDADMPTAETAAQLSGGLSAAAVEGMKLLVERNSYHAEGFHEVHVTDTTAGVQTRKAFQGRQLAQLEQSFNGTRTVWTSYLTPKENIAVVRTTLPDMVGVAAHANRREDGEDVVASKDKVQGLVEQLLGGSKANPWLDRAQTLLRSELPLRADFDLQLLNNPWRVVEFLADQVGDRGESARDANTSTDTSADANTDTNTVTDAGRATKGSSRGFAGAIPVDPAGAQNGHTAHPTDTDREERASHPWQASSQLEVFSSTEELREAAFRQVEHLGGLGAIPATLITATERGMNSGGVEYLDI